MVKLCPQLVLVLELQYVEGTDSTGLHHSFLGLDCYTCTTSILKLKALNTRTCLNDQ